MKYKSYRIVGGKPKWVIVDINGKITNKESNKEELKESNVELGRYYNKTNSCIQGNKLNRPNDMCDRCGTMSELVYGYPYREFDKDQNWTGKWICGKCYNEEYKLDERAICNRRTCNLDPNSSHAKGDIFQELTCKWRGVKDLNIENDNFTTSIDHSPDLELGIVQTRGSTYNNYGQRWCFSSLNREHNKKFDVMICYCTSKNGKIIERIYIFPKKEIKNRKSISIYKNPSKGYWYEKYRVNKNICEQVNDIWTNIRIN